MNGPEIQNEIRELYAEITEQLSYLRDIGVENLAADLPEIPAVRNTAPVAPERRRSTIEPEISSERAEDFVPADGFLESYPRPQRIVEQTKSHESRLGLLESTKLSHLSETPKRDPLKFSNRIKASASEDTNPAKAESAEATTLIDIRRTLPAANETVGDIRADIGDCKRCPLYAGRTNIVHSKGNFDADLMFVGEAPGADEDAKAEPFVGRAGQLLTKIIEGIGLKREGVLIGNINRCRPPGNRQPTIDESAACKPFLLREIAVVRPKVIVVLGNTATQNLLETKVGITKLRGNFQDYHGVKVMPTFHPAFLLRDPRKKREVWDDMKKVRDEINKLK